LKNNKKNIVLGIHFGYQHDSGAALVINNKIVAAIAEERISRIKKDPSFPIKSINKCLQKGGVLLSDVNHFAFGAKEIQYIPHKHSYNYLFKNGLGFFNTKLTQEDLRAFSINKFFRKTPFKELAKEKFEELGASPNATFGYYDHHNLNPGIHL